MFRVIGLDGGGTSTKGCIGYDKENIIAKSTAGGLNPYIYNEQEIISTLKYSINQLLIQSNIDVEDIDILSIGGAGLDRPNDQQQFEKLYRKTGFNIPLYLTNDAKILLEANIPSEPGILTISGTGSIAYGSDGVNYYRQGGYGHIIGDEGSGYDIGVTALKRIFKEKDNDNKILLETLILDYLDMSSLDDLLRWIYSPKTRKQDIADIVRCFIDKAYEDEGVRDILNNGTKDLIHLTTSLYSRMREKGVEPKKFIISGSVLSKNKYIRDTYIEEVENRTSMGYVESTVKAEVGALMMGLKKLEGELE